jgi:molecular chaperone HtpG
MGDTGTAGGTGRAGGQAPQAFQAEIAQLLHLMVHAVYSEREIFLRELISNASDACDKLRYEAIARPELIAGDDRLVIRIRPDKEGKALIVSDNGIGMDAAELADNLGTIARSGTRAFLEQIRGGKEAAGPIERAGDGPAGSGLIGQFGVGFYSAFMVAEEIEVTSRKAGTSAVVVWRSKGADGYTIAPAAAEVAEGFGRGTGIRLKLKADAESFLEAGEIERIVHAYSDHILFPVELVEPGKPPRQINAASALWQRPRSEVKPEEYKQVYQRVADQFDEPALTIHYRAEGRQSYAVLLFVPQHRPFDLFDPSRKGRLKLYVRRVYITDDADLLPSYLRFVKGVVDSEDLPLNISREMLQNNPQAGAIRKAVTGRVLSELEATAAKDRETYEKIYAAFGEVLKEGLYEDAERREQLLRLARFRSTVGDGWRSLADYAGAFRPSQTAIYYLAGDNLDRLKASPHLEAARAHGVEVLLLADQVDHFWTALQPGFEGKPLRSLTQGDVDLGSIPRVDGAATPETSDPAVGVLIARLKTALGERVSEVKASQRLVDSPACLVAAGAGPDLGLERLLQRQSRGLGIKPVLEINPRHALIKAAAAGPIADDPAAAADLAHLIHDQALIVQGEAPADPAAFARRLTDVLLKALRGP